MAKVKSPDCSDNESACEIIEAAIDDVDLLTRAFDLITEVCNERGGRPDTSVLRERIVLN